MNGDGDEQQRVAVGFGRAASTAPIAPPAPVRLSTTIVAFIASPSFCATKRATVSVPAPGGKGTIRRIGLAG